MRVSEALKIEANQPVEIGGRIVVTDAFAYIVESDSEPEPLQSPRMLILGSFLYEKFRELEVPLSLGSNVYFSIVGTVTGYISHHTGMPMFSASMYSIQALSATFENENFNWQVSET